MLKTPKSRDQGLFLFQNFGGNFFIFVISKFFSVRRSSVPGNGVSTVFPLFIVFFFFFDIAAAAAAAA